MKIYHWTNTEFNEQYAGGDVIVLVDNIEEARRKIIKDFKTHSEWLGEEYVKEKLVILKRDLSKEPENPTTIFISGSA